MRLVALVVTFHLASASNDAIMYATATAASSQDSWPGATGAALAGLVMTPCSPRDGEAVLLATAASAGVGLNAKCRIRQIPHRR